MSDIFLSTDEIPEDLAEFFEPGEADTSSVLTVNTTPFSGAHFATMPPKLVEHCVLAGSSSRVCEQCGTPWQRVAERGARPIEPQHRHPEKRLESKQAGNINEGNIGFRASRLSGQEITAWKALHPDKQLGWQPTCTCKDAIGSGKSLVLDPFAGAGTVLMVAAQFSREWLGIELNSDYIALASKRISIVQPNLWEGEL